MTTATWVLASATIGLFLATLALVWSTWKYIRATRDMAELSEADFIYRLYNDILNDPRAVRLQVLGGKEGEHEKLSQRIQAAYVEVSLDLLSRKFKDTDSDKIEGGSPPVE